LTTTSDANVVSTIAQGETLLEENRAYIVTYVTDRGEESAPSPASELIECDQNDTVDDHGRQRPRAGRNVDALPRVSVSDDESVGSLRLRAEF
jgi:hypothetical protein